MDERNKPHTLTVRIDPVDNRFEASIEEAGVKAPHWTMAGPAVGYEEAVEEIAEALKRHLLAR